MNKRLTFKASLCFLGWIISLQGALFSASASAATTAPTATGTIVFRGLTTGIDSSWTANTVGTSYTAWASDSTTSFARITYDTSHDYGLNYRLTDRTRESLYVKMWCRQNGGTAHGPKNFKIFGQQTNGSMSNTTIGLAGYGNEYDIYYGYSSTGSNDNSVEWRFSGATWGGTSFLRAAPVVVTTTAAPILIDNSWHEWGYYVKFNDDNTANGEVIILYDGNEVFHLKNVYNRANGALPIDNFGIGQYINAGTYAMTRDYRDVRVAYDGWPQSTDIKGNFIGAIAAPAAPSLTVSPQ